MPQEIIKKLICVTAEGWHLLYLCSWQMSIEWFPLSFTSLHLHDRTAAEWVRIRGRHMLIAEVLRGSCLWDSSQLLQPSHLHQDAAFNQSIFAEDVSQAGHFAPIAPVACKRTRSLMEVLRHGMVKERAAARHLRFDLQWQGL